MLKHFHKAGKTLAVVLSVLMIAVLGLVSCGDTEAIDAANAKAEEALNAANAALTEEEVEALLNELLGDAYASAEDVDAITKKLANFITSADLNDYAKASVVTSIQSQLTTLTNAGNTNKTDIATIKTQLAALQSAMDALTGAAGEGDTTGNALTAAKKETMTALDEAKAAIAANVYPTAVDTTIREAINAYNDVDVLCAVSVAELNAITEAVAVYKNHTSLADAVKAANELIAAIGSESAIAAKATLDGDKVTLNKAGEAVTADMYVSVLTATATEHKIGADKYNEYSVGTTLVAVNKLTSTLIVEKKNDSALDEFNGVGTLGADKKVLVAGNWYIKDTTLANLPVVKADGTPYTFNTITVKSGETLKAAQDAAAAIKADYGKTDGLNETTLNAMAAAYEAALKNADKAVYEAQTAIKSFIAAADTAAGVKVSRWKASTIIDMLGIDVTLEGSKGLTYMTGNTLSSKVTFNAEAPVYVKYKAAVDTLAMVQDLSKVENYADFEAYAAALNDNLTAAVVEAVETELDTFARNAASANGVASKKVTTLVADYAVELEALTMNGIATFADDAKAFAAVANNCVAAIIDRAYFELNAYDVAVETALNNLMSEDSDETYLAAINVLFESVIDYFLNNGNEEADLDPVYNEKSEKGQPNDLFVYEYTTSTGKVKEVTLSKEDILDAFLPWGEDYDENAVAALEADQAAFYNTVVALYNDVTAIITDAYETVETYEVTGTYEAATAAINAIAGTKTAIYYTYNQATSLNADKVKALNTVEKALANELLGYNGEFVLYLKGVSKPTAIGYAFALDEDGDLLTYEDLYDATYEAWMETYKDGATWNALGATLNYVEKVAYPTNNNFSVILKADITTVSYVPVADKYNYSANNEVKLYDIAITSDMNSDIEAYIETTVLDTYAALNAAIVDDADMLTLIVDFNKFIGTTAPGAIGSIITSAVFADFKATVIEVLTDYLDYYEVNSRSTEAEKALYEAVEAHINELVADVEAVEAATSADYAKAIAKILGSNAKFEHNTYYAANLDVMTDAKLYAAGYANALLGNEALADYTATVIETLTEGIETVVEVIENDTTIGDFMRDQKIFLVNSILTEWTTKINNISVGNTYTTTTWDPAKTGVYKTLEDAQDAVDALLAAAEGYANDVVAGVYTGTADDFVAANTTANDTYTAFKNGLAYNAGIQSLIDAKLKEYLDGTDKGVINTTFAQYAGKDATDLGGFTAWLNGIKAITASFDADDVKALNALFTDMETEYGAYEALLTKLSAVYTGTDAVLAEYAATKLAAFKFNYTADVTNTYTAKAAFGYTTGKKIESVDGRLTNYSDDANTKMVKNTTWDEYSYQIVTYKADGKVDTDTKEVLKGWYTDYMALYTTLNALNENN